MKKNAYRHFIEISHRLGHSPSKIYNDLKESYDARAPSYATVWRWVSRFKATESNNVDDKPRSGRPATAITSSNIERVRVLIQKNPHISYAQIEAETSLNPNSIYSIIHEHLKFRKLASRWIPHELTEQKRKRVAFSQENLKRFKEGKWRLCDVMTGDESWFYCRSIGRKQSNSRWVPEGESPATVVRRCQFEKKALFTIFFKSTGPLLIDCIDKGKTINSRYYKETILKNLFKEVKKQRNKSGLTNLKLLHDNAKPHTSKMVNNFLKEQGITTIKHPPRSPDLAPCDFWLFSYIKKRLDSHKTVKALKLQITRIVNEIPKQEWAKTFDKYLERLQACINNKGEYFEHIN